MRALHKIRHSLNSKVLGAGLILIGVAFLLAGIGDILFPLTAQMVGIALALVGAALVAVETHMLTHHERKHVYYGAILYIIATAISMLSGKGAPYRSQLLVAHSAVVQSGISTAAGLAFSTIIAMIVGSMVYISFYLFIHRLSPLRYRPLVFLCLLGGLLVTLIGIPAYAILHFYVNGVSDYAIVFMEGTVNLAFAAVYVLAGLSWT